MSLQAQTFSCLIAAILPAARRHGLVASAVAALAAGCAGVVQHDAQDGAARNTAGRVPSRGVIRIEAVENRTGRPECDDLAHFVHLKAAEVLDRVGWAVVGDELVAQAEFLGLAPTAARDRVEKTLRISLLQADEKAGATVAVAILSSQQQSAEISLRLEWRDEARGVQGALDSRGASSKGAWGVLAKVNREALLRREGYWAVDRSLLGRAAADALARGVPKIFP